MCVCCGKFNFAVIISLQKVLAPVPEAPPTNGGIKIYPYPNLILDFATSVEREGRSLSGCGGGNGSPDQVCEYNLAICQMEHCFENCSSSKS